jgi:hypothetical protein
MAGRIRSIEKFTDLIRNQTHDLLACSTVPQATTLLRAPACNTVQYIYINGNKYVSKASSINLPKL